jgi:hypothetical protein
MSTDLCYRDNEEQMNIFVREALHIQPELNGFSRSLKTFYIRKTLRSPHQRPDLKNAIEYSMGQKELWKDMRCQTSYF